MGRPGTRILVLEDTGEAAEPDAGERMVGGRGGACSRSRVLGLERSGGATPPPVRGKPPPDVGQGDLTVGLARLIRVTLGQLADLVDATWVDVTSSRREP